MESASTPRLREFMNVAGRDSGGIDRNSSTPLYQQIAGRLERDILANRYPPGERIENEVAMADSLGVARETVRQAIKSLVQKGLLVRQRGRGTIVVHRPFTRKMELRGLHEDLREMGRAPETKVLYFGRKVPEDSVLRVLGLPPGTEVLRIRRVRYADGLPLAVMENYLPVGTIDATLDQLESRSLYELMRESGASPSVAQQRITAAEASPEVATLLEVRRLAPVLKIERESFDSSGRGIEVATHFYRPDLFSYETRLVASDTSA